MIKRENIEYISFRLFEVLAYLACGVIFAVVYDLPPSFSHPLIEIFWLTPSLLSLWYFVSDMRGLFAVKNDFCSLYVL